MLLRAGFPDPHLRTISLTGDYPRLRNTRKFISVPTAGTIYRPQSGPSPSRAPGISKSTETIRPRHLSARDVWPIAAGDNSGGGDAAMLLPFCSGLMEKHSIKTFNKTPEEIPNQGEHTHLLFEFRTSGTRPRIVRFEWVCDKDPGPHNLIPVPLLFVSAATVLPPPPLGIITALSRYRPTSSQLRELRHYIPQGVRTRRRNSRIRANRPCWKTIFPTFCL